MSARRRASPCAVTVKQGTDERVIAHPPVLANIQDRSNAMSWALGSCRLRAMESPGRGSAGLDQSRRHEPADRVDDLFPVLDLGAVQEVADRFCDRCHRGD
jgi:hypothetical protein